MKLWSKKFWKSDKPRFDRTALVGIEKGESRLLEKNGLWDGLVLAHFLPQQENWTALLFNSFF